MTKEEYRALWLAEEERAHIRGWDFSPIQGRYEEENDLPWDYRAVIDAYLRDEHELLDIDTGGGEFLQSLRHPCARTAATEGYPPNVALCRERLLPLGIDFRAMSRYDAMPFEDERFDVIINRHGAYDAAELRRVTKRGGRFITEQVGEDNDRELVELLLPGTDKPFPGCNLATQRALLEGHGWEIVRAEECFRPIRFFDVGALVWFARVVEWEFPRFSVNACWERLCAAQEMIEEKGFIEGRVHRYLMVAERR